MYYFDYAATTPVCSPAKTAMLHQLDCGWQNPSAQYESGVAVAKDIAGYRNTIASALGCQTEEFYFTSGGTESNHWAITEGVYLGRHRGKHCITSSVEHASVLACFKNLEKKGYSVTYLKPNKEGFVSASQVEEALREDTVLVSFMLVNNETGVIFPVDEIAKKVKKFNQNILVHSDGIQGFLKLPFSLSGAENSLDLSHVDLLSITGHKVFAPKGIGGLFIRKSVKLNPVFYGGGQEKGLRSGTEPSQQMAAFAEAVRVGVEDFPQRRIFLSQLKEQIIQEISKIPQVKILFHETSPTAPHILCISLVAYPSQVVLRFLSQRGVCVSAGSACHRGKESHVFSSMPLEKPVRDGILRLSISSYTTEEDVSALIQGLQSATKELLPNR